MSAPDFDTLISSVGNQFDFLNAEDNSIRTDSAEEFSPERVAAFNSEKSFPTDYRIRQLSYSSLLTLNSCPKKFQLYKLRATRAEDSSESKITFSFGHAVGHAIQRSLSNVPENKIIWELFQMWPLNLLETHSKFRKNIWEAIFALQKFNALKDAGMFEGWEVLEHEGVPACELSFCINLPNGFRYRGHVDIVLKNILTGEIRVIELKTTGMKTVNPAQYKNSAQALGYSVVLDHVAPEISSYEVQYLVYQTESREFTPFLFTKSYLQRALWIKDIILDMELISMYESENHYPTRGESCFSFMKECEYISVCHLPVEHLTQPATPAAIDMHEYQINVTLDDLLTSQLAKIQSLDTST